MAKPQKLKRYSQSSMTGSRRSGLRLFVMFLGLGVGGGLLVWLGIVLYSPVSEFLLNIGQESPSSSIADLLDELNPPEPEEIPPEPEPEPTKSEQAGDLRMAYLPIGTARDAGALESFLAALEGTAVNTLLLDVKDEQGGLHYVTAQPQALEWGAQAEGAIDLAALAQTLENREMHLAARMQMFSDPIAARGDRVKNAIHYQTSDMLWLDNFADQGGKPWLNPYAPESRAYLTAIAEELADLGAVMVVLDGLRFPDDNGTSAVYGAAADGATRLSALQTTTSQISKALEQKGVRTAVYLPATALTSAQRETRYGTISPLESAGNEVVLGVLPYSFGTGFSGEGLELSAPETDPAGTVATLLTFAKGQGTDVKLIPLLQGGNEPGGTVYQAEQITAQLDAVSAAGYTEYVLYTTTGNYLLS